MLGKAPGELFETLEAGRSVAGLFVSESAVVERVGCQLAVGVEVDDAIQLLRCSGGVARTQALERTIVELLHVGRLGRGDDRPRKLGARRFSGSRGRPGAGAPGQWRRGRAAGDGGPCQGSVGKKTRGHVPFSVARRRGVPGPSALGPFRAGAESSGAVRCCWLRARDPLDPPCRPSTLVGWSRIAVARSSLSSGEDFDDYDEHHRSRRSWHMQMAEPTAVDRIGELERAHQELKDSVRQLERRAYFDSNGATTNQRAQETEARGEGSDSGAQTLSLRVGNRIRTESATPSVRALRRFVPGADPQSGTHSPDWHDWPSGQSVFALQPPFLAPLAGSLSPGLFVVSVAVEPLLSRCSPPP